MMTDRCRFTWKTPIGQRGSVSAPIPRIKNVPIATKEKSTSTVALAAAFRVGIPVSDAATPAAIPIKPTVKRAAVPAG